MAELADAHDSKSCILTDMWVQFPPSAHCGGRPRKIIPETHARVGSLLIWPVLLCLTMGAPLMGDEERAILHQSDVQP